jgi:hypothetical protein
LVLGVQLVVWYVPGLQMSAQVAMAVPPVQNELAGHAEHTRFTVVVQAVVWYVPASQIVQAVQVLWLARE